MAIQKTETECGCTITSYGDGSAPPEVEHCDMHHAAPVLLAACQEALDFCEGVLARYHIQELYTRLELAIARARGQQ